MNIHKPYIYKGNGEWCAMLPDRPEPTLFRCHSRRTWREALACVRDYYRGML